jgi:hypothetical protein
MQITLNQEEIVGAILKHVESQGLTLDDTKINVTLATGRGANGTTATIDFGGDALTKKPRKSSKKPPKEAAEPTPDSVAAPETEGDAEPAGDAEGQGDPPADDPAEPAADGDSEQLFG